MMGGMSPGGGNTPTPNSPYMNQMQPRPTGGYGNTPVYGYGATPNYVGYGEGITSAVYSPSGAGAMVMGGASQHSSYSPTGMNPH